MYVVAAARVSIFFIMTVFWPPFAVDLAVVGPAPSDQTRQANCISCTGRRGVLLQRGKTRVLPRQQLVYSSYSFQQLRRFPRQEEVAGEHVYTRA